MIASLKQVIRANPQWLRTSDADLSFLKMSTTGYLHEPEGGKVLLFVFERGEKQPTICAKTTRTHATGTVIRRNYFNLRLLAEGVRGSDYRELFAKPLYLHDRDNLIFSLESVCHGEKLALVPRNTPLVLKKFIGWQSHLSVNAKKIWNFESIANLANKTIKSLGLSEVSTLVLKDFYKYLAVDPEIRLPALIQHGDFTVDNVLVSRDGVCLVDCDYVGISTLPGFDLFNLFFKSGNRLGSLQTNCDKYFPRYFATIGARVLPEAYASIWFIHYLRERQRKKHLATYREKSGEEIVDSFRSLFGQ